MEMNGLVAFLGACLDEDERIARQLDDYDEYGNDLTVGQCMGYPCERYLAIGRGRVLAEVEAKRRILDLHAEIPGDGINYTLAEQYRAEEVLQLLALPFSDRPGFDESWRPS